MGLFGIGIFRAVAMVGAIMATFGLEINALAQANSCSRLQSSLRSLERSPEFRNLAANTQRARELGDALRATESAFVRGGCQDALNAGQTLASQCRDYARAITSGRSDYARLAAAIQAGETVAAQREHVLQEIARFGCGTGVAPGGSQATVQTQQRPRNILEEIFGVPGGYADPSMMQDQSIVEEPDPYQNMSTVRSVCVRTCDGYYWPVSFSTVHAYLGQDAAQCAQGCPGAEVALYYYYNPGQTPEQMVDMSGRPYTALPTAFNYRERLDEGCSCRQQINYGIVTIAGGETAGQSRAVIEFGEQEFPLPMRDPRRAVEAVVVEAAETVWVEDIPLPRPRPDREGLRPVVTATGAPGGGADGRVIQFGDRRVRVVGPDTPYARTTEAAPEAPDPPADPSGPA